MGGRVCVGVNSVLAVLCCVCVLALVSSDTRYHLTSGPVGVRRKLCGTSRTMALPEARTPKADVSNCTGKNHTKRLTRRLHEGDATCVG